MDKEDFYDSEVTAVKPPKKQRKKEVKKRSDAPKKPRAPSAYILFCKATRPKVRAEEPTLKVTEVTAKLGSMWKELDEATKRHYIEESVATKEELAKKNATAEAAVVAEESPTESEIAADTEALVAER